jgi:hypothetical protein
MLAGVSAYAAKDVTLTASPIAALVNNLLKAFIFEPLLFIFLNLANEVIAPKFFPAHEASFRGKV